jgi:hypothetical protein
MDADNILVFFAEVLWVAVSIPLGSLLRTREIPCIDHRSRNERVIECDNVNIKLNF